MLWTIVGILFILWLLGFSFHVAGGLVHILLVVALVAVIFNLLSGDTQGRRLIAINLHIDLRVLHLQIAGHVLNQTLCARVAAKFGL